jgi:hypothetical protein
MSIDSWFEAQLNRHLHEGWMAEKAYERAVDWLAKHEKAYTTEKDDIFEREDGSKIKITSWPEIWCGEWTDPEWEEL